MSAPLVNRHFGIALLALLLLGELVLRAAPWLGAPFFRITHGNSLAMSMSARDRLRATAASVRVLALGDSLGMTQFQPDRFAELAGLPPGAVFNASYLGMSFPSQLDLLQSVGREPLSALRSVIYFVNPRRLSEREVPNTDVLRVGVRPARPPVDEVWRTGRLAPLLDASRLYGLSRHLVVSAWRTALWEPASWDQLEYLGPHGGVAWPGRRVDPRPPPYPHPPLAQVSEERLAEMRTVLEWLARSGADVWLVPSALHPRVDPFASDAARARFAARIAALARETGARDLHGVLEGFHPPDDRDFCDYGHMNARGGAAYTRHLHRRAGARLAGLEGS